MRESVWARLARAEADLDAMLAGEPMESVSEREAREAYERAGASLQAARERFESVDRALYKLSSEMNRLDQSLKTLSDPGEIVEAARARATAQAAADELRAWARHASESVEHARRARIEAEGEYRATLSRGLDRELEPLKAQLSTVDWSVGVMSGTEQEAARERVKHKMAAVRAKWARRAERNGL